MEIAIATYYAVGPDDIEWAVEAFEIAGPQPLFQIRVIPRYHDPLHDDNPIYPNWLRSVYTAASKADARRVAANITDVIEMKHDEQFSKQRPHAIAGMGRRLRIRKEDAK